MKIRTTFFLLLFFLLSNFVTADLTTDNILYLAEDDQSLVNQTFNGNPSSITGKIKGSINFDGTGDYINHNLPSIGGGNQTYSFLIKTTTASNEFIVDNNVASTATDRLSIQMLGGGITAYAKGSGGDSLRASNSTINDGSWHHIVVFFNTIDDDIQIYIDGTLDQQAFTNTGMGAITTQGSSFIGTDDSNTIFFNGQIDDVRIYNKSLNITEISSLYNSGSGTEDETIAPSNLIFHSDMNEGYSLSNNSFTTTINSLILNRDGYFNNAFQFDTNTDTLVFNESITTSSTTETVSLWVKFTGSNGVAWDWIIGNSDGLSSTDEGFQFFRTDATGYITAIIGNGGGAGQYAECTNSVAIADTNWHHLAYTLNSTGFYYYQDGSLANGCSDTSFSGTKGTPSNNLNIGDRPAAGGYGLIGLVDEVSIWNRSLSAAEILELYQLTSNFYSTNATPTVNNFSITAINNKSNASINNFIALVEQETTSLKDYFYNKTVIADEFYYFQNNALIDKDATLLITYSTGTQNATIPSSCLNNFNVTVQWRSAIPTDLWQCLNSSNEYETFLTFGGVIVTNVQINFSGNYEYYNTSTGQINTTILENSTILHNISIYSNNYYDYFNNNYNVSSNLEAFLNPYYYVDSVNLLNNVTYNLSNYIRIANYSIALQCPDFSNTSIKTYVNDTNVLNTTVNCINSTTNFNINYTYSTEGLFNYTLRLFNDLDSSFNNSILITNNLITDLFNPNITLNNLSVPVGFYNPLINSSVTCQDSITPLLLYDIYLNSDNIFNGNLTNGTTQNNNSLIAIDGDNILNSTCYDFFGSTNDIKTLNIYAKTLILIDEEENTLFDVNNVSDLKIYFDDNSTVINMKSLNASSINFTSLDNEKLRVEIYYATGDVITRWVDVSLLNEDIRICANVEGVTHYEQLIISSSIQPAVLESVFANCIVAADYTRFAYQDAYVLKAFTTNHMYSLFKITDGVETILASVDGSIQTFMNIDQLEFQQTAYNLDITGDGLSFTVNQNNQVLITYINLNNDSLGTSLSITRLDTNAIVYTKSDFLNPNQFQIIFDYTTLNNVSDTTLFRVDIIKTLENDITKEIRKYFNTAAKTGYFNTGLGIALSLIVFALGLLSTIARTTFSWFGFLITICAIGILGFTISSATVLFIMALEIIALIFIAILMVTKNTRTLV